MMPTAISQLFEQVFRAVFGLTLTYVLLDKGIPVAAGGASFGASAGAIEGTIVILFIYLRHRKQINKEFDSEKKFEEGSISKIAKQILYIAIPITIGAAAKLGRLSGNAQTVINIPQVLSVAIAMSLVPVMSDAFARKDNTKIKNTTDSSIRLTLLIGIPCAVGLFTLSYPIIDLIYFTKPLQDKIATGGLLAILSISLVFLILIQSLTAILQGIGKPMKPVKNLAVGALIKIVLTYTLIRIPGIEIKGADISTVVTYFVAAALNLYDVKKYTGVQISFIDTAVKPIISVAIMGIVVKISYVYSVFLL